MPSFVNPGLRSYTHRSTIGSSFGTGQSDAGEPMYGRVIDVVLDSTHPRYDSLGRSQALYGVFYQPLFVGDVEDHETDYNLRFAYCKQNSLRQIPIRNEIVQLEEGPAGAMIQERKDEGFVHDVFQKKIYWTSIVPVWNHPHLNIYPDVVRFDNGFEEVADMGENFEENRDIKPLQLSPGDVVLEGRHGQSLRFGGTKSQNGTSFSEDENNGKPYTILRNGQAKAEGNVCIEDIDNDDASIYLVSDHRVPISEAKHKFAAAVKMPPLAKDYKGKQIVANSDQIVINARENNLELAAKEHLSGNAKTVSLDGEDYLGLDADNIYLGAHAQKKLNPVLKGQEAIDLLNDAFGVINTFLGTIGKAPSEPYSWVAVATLAAGVADTSLKSILARINSIKSSKVYTE